MRKRYWTLFFILLFSVSLLGCSSSTTPPVPSITVIAPSPTVDVGENAYPAYPAPFLDPYPGPGGSGSLPPVTKVVPVAIAPTQDASMAMVMGKILLLDEPVTNVILYIAPIITNESGGQMVRFERTTSIRTVTDENGNFSFPNVPVGRYGIVLDKVLDSYLLLAPGGDENLIIEITGNEHLDLGELKYDDLPVTP